MSYDVYFVIPSASGGDEAVLSDRNYTSNVSCMWAKALDLPDRQSVDDDGKPRTCSRYNRETGEWERDQPLMDFGVRLLHNAPASEAAGVLAAAVERMAANPDDYTPMNPENGWGDYEGALDFLRWMADTAAAYPMTTIKVSS